MNRHGHAPNAPPRRRRRAAAWAAAAPLLLLAPALGGCRYPEMYDQPKYEEYDASAFFADGTAMRPLVAGTVARVDPRGEPREAAYRTGRGGDGQFIDALPPPLDDPRGLRGILERGRDRFTIFCAPCHGVDGAGRGPIVLRGFSPPPKLYEPKVARQPLGYYFDVITHGFGAMYSYAARVPPRDRWAIAAYLRALQRSQQADPGRLPPSLQNELERASRRPAPPLPPDDRTAGAPALGEPEAGAGPGGHR